MNRLNRKKAKKAKRALAAKPGKPPFPFIVMLIISVVLFVVGQLLIPDPAIEDAKAGGIEDFGFPTSLESRAIPLAFGSNKIKAPNTIWYGDLKVKPITERIKVSIFKKKTIVVGHIYSVGFDLAVCMGPVESVSLIRVENEILIQAGQSKTPLPWYHDPAAILQAGGGIFTFIIANLLLQNNDIDGKDDTPNGGMADGNYRITRGGMWGGYKDGGGMTGTLRIYTGQSVVPPNEYVKRKVAAGSSFFVPGYTGICRVVWMGGVTGESPQMRKWEIVVHNYPSLPGYESWSWDKININNTYWADANPICVIYNIMNNNDYGVGIPADKIDLPSFADAASTVKAEGNGFSFNIGKAQNATKIVESAMTQINGTMFQKKDGKFYIHLNRDNYVHAALPLFDESNITKVHKTSRQSWAQTFNSLHLTYFDRSEEWKETHAIAHDLGAVNANSGVQTVKKVKYPGVRQADQAARLAARDLHTVSSPAVTIEFDTLRTGDDLFPGSVIRVNFPEYQIDDEAFRITQISLGSLTKGGITIHALQDRFTNNVPTNIGGGLTIHEPIVTVPVIAATERVIGVPRWMERFYGESLDPGGATFTGTRCLHLVAAPDQITQAFTALTTSAIGQYSLVTGRESMTPMLTMSDPGTQVDSLGDPGPLGVISKLVAESDIYIADGGLVTYPVGHARELIVTDIAPVISFKHQPESSAGSSIIQATDTDIKEFGYSIIQIDDEIMAFEQVAWRDGNEDLGEYTYLEAGPDDPAQTVDGLLVEPGNSITSDGSAYTNLVLAGVSKVHRGLFDTDIANHAYGADVWFLTQNLPVVDIQDVRTGLTPTHTYVHRTESYHSKIDPYDASQIVVTEVEMLRPTRPIRPANISMQTLTGAAGHNVATARTDKVTGWVNQTLNPTSLEVFMQDEPTTGGLDRAVTLTYTLKAIGGAHAALAGLTHISGATDTSHTLTPGAIDTAAGWVYTRANLAVWDVDALSLSTVDTVDTTGIEAGMVVTGDVAVFGVAGRTVDVVTQNVNFTLTAPCLIAGNDAVSTLTITGYQNPTTREMSVTLTRKDGVLDAYQSPVRYFTVDGHS